MQNRDTFGISTVERDTGLSKDSLRTWERRYGFPKPLRDSKGERLYPGDQVEKLRVMRRLMDAGFHPGKIIDQSLEDLLKLGIEKKRAIRPSKKFDGEIGFLLQAIKTREIGTLRKRLRWQLARLGIRRFVTELVAVANEVVGNAWARGEINTAGEHLYTEQVELVLRSAAAEILMEPKGPAVLLTTLPGEQHKLGLLMLEAILSVELARCVPLGTQTPISEIVGAAIASEVDIVALSFSSAFPRNAALKGLADLRAALPAHISIWAGGDGVKGVRKRPDGVLISMDLAMAIAQLDSLSSSPAPSA